MVLSAFYLLLGGELSSLIGQIQLNSFFKRYISWHACKLRVSVLPFLPKKFINSNSWHNLNYGTSCISSFLIPSKSVIIRINCSSLHAYLFSVVAATGNNFHRTSSSMPGNYSPSHSFPTLFLFIYLFLILQPRIFSLVTSASKY